MDYPCAKFNDFNFSRFGFIVRTHTQRERERERERITDAAKRLSHATVVGVSNYNNIRQQP